MVCRVDSGFCHYPGSLFPLGSLWGTGRYDFLQQSQAVSDGLVGGGLWHCGIHRRLDQSNQKGSSHTSLAGNGRGTVRLVVCGGRVTVSALKKPLLNFTVLGIKVIVIKRE